MKKFICVVCMFFLCIGLMRVAFGAYASSGNFIPTYDELLTDFGKMPNLPLEMANDFANIVEAGSTMANNFSDVHDIGSFFVAIGNFFQVIWTVIIMLADTIVIPVRWLIWCFTSLFSLSPTN